MQVNELRVGESLMPSHPLTNFKVQKYYRNEPLMAFIQEVIYLK